MHGYMGIAEQVKGMKCVNSAFMTKQNFLGQSVLIVPACQV